MLSRDVFSVYHLKEFYKPIDNKNKYEKKKQNIWWIHKMWFCILINLLTHNTMVQTKTK